MKLLVRIKEEYKQKIKEEIKREECIKRLNDTNLYIISENADPYNILIDTCAINDAGTRIMKEAENVWVLNQVIEEMDKVKYREKIKKKKDWRIHKHISQITKYSSEMLKNPKYKLIDNYNRKKPYVDDIIIDYLKKSKKRNRPTLLTADRMLALRAKCLNIQYIFILPETKK